jgi:hypothetical protein
MNIKQHIEAGHYPKDEKGRAIVPTTDPNEEAVIAATDAPGQWVLMGWVRQKAGPDMSQASWWPTGAKGSHASIPLLPPAPRKVTVRFWIEIERDTGFKSSVWRSDEPSGGVRPRPGCVIVELTGSYDEPWS